MGACDCCASAPVARHTLRAARKNTMMKAVERPWLLGWRVVAGLSKDVEGWEPFGRLEFDFDLPPETIALCIARFVSQDILVTELHPDLCRYIGQFADIGHGKNSSSGHLGHFGQQRRTVEFFAGSRTNPDRVVNTDCIELAVGFFQEILYIVLTVATMIITPIGYDEQGPFGVMCTPHLAQPQIDRIEQCRSAARSRKHHAGLQFFHAISEAAGELRAIVKADQKKLVERVCRTHKLHSGLASLVHLVRHAAAHIKNQSNGNRNVLARQGHNFLFASIFINPEIFFFQTGNQTVQWVGHSDVYERKTNVNFNSFTWLCADRRFGAGGLNGALSLGGCRSRN